MLIKELFDEVQLIGYDENFILIPYSKENFLKSIVYSKSLISEGRFYPRHLIEKSPLFNYLSNYFEYFCHDDREIEYKAKLIVIENEFISESYLNDIKHFYADCFSDYTKKCKRIHFFDKFYSDKDFEKLILEGDELVEKKINENYLGNITVKPTGNSIIGPTFLRPYPFVKAKRIRYYNSLIELSFNLFGKKMRVKGLVFQEQDQTIGLCATQAIWSSTQALSKTFKTSFIYPADISIKAGFNNSSGRIFPNNGLTNQQIYTIYSSLGLACDVISSGTAPLFNNKLLKRIIYAYNKSGIPILLGYKRRGSDSKDRHIVTIVGFRINEKLSDENQKNKVIPTYSDRVKRIYCHDDQLGPYAKIGVVDEDIEYNNDGNIKINFEKETSESQDASVTTLIIPLRKSIRIKFEHIEQSIASFDIIHCLFIKKEGYRYRNYEWDIYLDKGTNYKNDIIKSRESVNCDNETILKVALSNFPKYVWIARLYLYNELGEKNFLYDIVYDASESSSLNNFCVHKMFFYDKLYGRSILQLMLKNQENLIALFDQRKEVRFSEQHITTFEFMLNL